MSRGIFITLEGPDGAGKRMLVICSMVLVIISSHMLKLSIDRTTLIEMEGVNAIMGVIWEYTQRIEMTPYIGCGTP